MQWDRTASTDQPPSGRRRGRATAMVVAELGLDEAALADALAWARGRVDELLAALDDAELRALLDPADAPGRGTAREEIAAAKVEASAAEGIEDGIAEMEILGLEPEPSAVLELVPPLDPSDALELPELPEPEVLLPTAPKSIAAAPVAKASERRTTPRYSLVEPAVIEVESWAELVALYTKDIGCGGMFVQTDAPPQRDVQVAVQLLLPDGAGVLVFEGVVVHVVTAEQAAATGSTAGFGLQFSGLTAERRRALQRLVEHAEATAARRSAGSPTPEELAEAYRRLCEAVRATGSVPPPPPFGTTPPSRPTPVEPPLPVRRPRSTPPPVPPSVSPLEADAVMAQQRARMARRLMSRLADRDARRSARLERRDPSAAPPRSPRDEHRALVDEALRLVADKRYLEAAERLELALRRRPEPRVRVLLCVVQARQALVERDFSRARARYEAVLQLDPNNELAQRELLMLSALVP